MAERGRRDDTRATTPDRFAETLPPEVAREHSFSVQAIYELQRAFGKIEHAVENLEKRAEEQAKSLKSVERTLYIATGAFIIISGIIGLAVKYGLDMLATLVAAKH